MTGAGIEAFDDSGNAGGAVIGRRAVTPDTSLAGIDVEAAITRGLLWDGAARRAWYTEGAIAASWQAEELGVGPYPIAFLGRCVRSMGLERARDLPEPLIGAEPAHLARTWMSAAADAGAGLAGDVLFARWLEIVAQLIAVRRTARSGESGSAASSPTQARAR